MLPFISFTPSGCLENPDLSMNQLGKVVVSFVETEVWNRALHGDFSVYLEIFSSGIKAGFLRPLSFECSTASKQPDKFSCSIQ
jgi:hypothetical protein